MTNFTQNFLIFQILHAQYGMQCTRPSPKPFGHRLGYDINVAYVHSSGQIWVPIHCMNPGAQILGLEPLGPHEVGAYEV